MPNNGYIGRAPGDSSVIIARQDYQPTGVQTDFTFSAGYDPGYTECYVNGVKLVIGRDYTATDGSVVGLVTAANSGDIVELIAYKAFNLGAINSSTGNFSVGNNLTVENLSTLVDVNVSGAVTANAFAGDGSALTGVASTDYIITGTAATFNSQVKVFNLNVTGITTSQDIRVGNGLTVVGAAQFDGNVTIGGTLTYEDVTNVDSVGLVTAQTGVRVTAGGLVVTAGVTTLTDDVKVNSTLSATEGLHVTAGVTTIAGNQTVAGTAAFAQKTTVNATLEATEGLNVTAGVTTIAGTSSFAQKTTVNATLNATEGLHVSAGVVTAAGAVSAAGAITGSAGVDVSGGQLTVGSGVTIGAAGIATFSGGVDFNGGSILKEKVNIVAGKASDNTNINLSFGQVWHFTTVETANFVPNIMSNTGINTSMEIGDTISVSIATSCAAVSWAATVTVDGAAVNEQKWGGGSAPTAGGASGHDLYTHNVIKTAANTYTVLSNVTNFG